jgi:hypothetical protein
MAYTRLGSPDYFVFKPLGASGEMASLRDSPQKQHRIPGVGRGQGSERPAGNTPAVLFCPNRGIKPEDGESC